METAPEIARKTGISIRQVRRWTSLRLLPRPCRVSRGPGRTIAAYPAGTSNIVKLALRIRGEGKSGSLAKAFERARWGHSQSLQPSVEATAFAALRKRGAEGILELRRNLEQLLIAVPYAASEALADILARGLVEACINGGTLGYEPTIRRLLDFQSNLASGSISRDSRPTSS